jgi:hypothetical protein
MCANTEINMTFTIYKGHTHTHTHQVNIYGAVPDKSLSLTLSLDTTSSVKQPLRAYTNPSVTVIGYEEQCRVIASPLHVVSSGEDREQLTSVHHLR